MALYSYVKKIQKPQRKAVVVISYTSLIIGTFFLFWSLYPIISFEIFANLFIKKSVLTPVPQTDIATSLEAAKSVLGSYSLASTNLSDYTKAGIWFPARPQEKTATPLAITEYSLSIPKLNVKDAKVIVGGDDLTKGLIHYLPKSFPGEYGNVAIFGHSTLPALSKPKDYKSIFTFLPSLNKGDEIFVKIGNNTYQYTVCEMIVVKPDQVSVLDQRYDNSYLSVITCVPQGTYLNRLVVRAKLGNCV